MASPLRDALDETGLSLKDVTVLAPQNDPFRVDTPARHRDGEWLGTIVGDMRDRGLLGNRIHLRGLHYGILEVFDGRLKPDGLPYTNTDENWLWLSEGCAKAARWLGYVGFDQIFDKRNAAPVVRIHEPPMPTPYVNVGINIEIPDAASLMPKVACADFRGTQPYKLVMFGEKSSLEEVLGPIAEQYHVDLYLPTGEISDTLLHQMARVGAEDGRPMVVLCFSDCDPAGWQMPISIARKLQAFKTLLFKDLDFEVRRVGLTPNQVRELGLRSSPLKETERRADRWREAMRVDQTEIDSLILTRPEELRRLAQQAIAPFFDSTLDRRVAEARRAWQTEAQTVIDASLDTERLERIRDDATERLDAMQADIEHLNEALQIDADDFDLPDPVIPDAQSNGASNGKPLIDSRWSFVEQTQRLIRAKAYLPDEVT